MAAVSPLHIEGLCKGESLQHFALMAQLLERETEDILFALQSTSEEHVQEKKKTESCFYLFIVAVQRP